MKPKRTAVIYEVRRRENRRGIDLISDAPPFGRLWYSGDDAIPNAIGYARFLSRAHHYVIRVFDCDGALIETHDDDRDFRGAK